jgi:hypothetical protein
MRPCRSGADSANELQEFSSGAGSRWSGTAETPSQRLIKQARSLGQRVRFLNKLIHVESPTANASLKPLCARPGSATSCRNFETAARAGVGTAEDLLPGQAASPKKIVMWPYP